MSKANVAAVSLRRQRPGRCAAPALRVSSLLFVAVLLQACGSLPERNPLPPELTNEAVIDGIPHARFWADEWPKFSLQRFATLSEAQIKAKYEGIYAKPHSYLAISGGGANGAFGAGLLAGWTAAGTRPEFTMVTGVSTCALSAPFAFLGPDYDEQLKKVYAKLAKYTFTNLIKLDCRFIQSMYE